jgi:superfamily II DNA/RNA helicase
VPTPFRSYNVSTSFADLGVPARLVEALTAEGITTPFPVQAATLPDALAGRDLCGRAPTGSGKTLGFGIPLMARVSQAQPTKPTGLVLVPTRELAEQVQRAFVPLGRAQWRFIQAIYGGASFGPQIHSLRKGASVIVATPGRLLDIIEKGYCDLGSVEVCVIDEADRMADLGFMPDVRKLLDMTPATRQTMLWSATLDGDVNELIRDYMTDPVHHDLVGDAEPAPVDHRFIVTRPSDRLTSTVALVEEHGPSIVFVKTRFGVEDVTDALNEAGVRAGALHGARSQALRQRTLDDFKRGRLQALVATDVAARGIHVDNVSLVLHWDMPDNDKDYTHRSGRTGRAGNAGLVVAFVPPNRQRIAQRLSETVNAPIEWERNETPATRPRRFERDEAPRRDRNDWTPRPRRDEAPRRDRNDSAPSPRRDESPRFERDSRPPRRDRNDWAPRPRRDDDRLNNRPPRAAKNGTNRSGGYPAKAERRSTTDRPRPAGRRFERG